MTEHDYAAAAGGAAAGPAHGARQYQSDEESMGSPQRSPG